MHTVKINETKTGRQIQALHTFYRMLDGSFLAFFELHKMHFEFKRQHDFDLHIALEVSNPVLHDMFEKGKSQGVETRGIVDHQFIESIYFRDPEGNRIEVYLDSSTDNELQARSLLDQWTASLS